MKTTMLNIPWYDGSMHRAKCVVINARWAAYQHDALSGWSLTHRATGYASGKGLRTVAAVRRLARALERLYGAKRWTFTDPTSVKGMTKAKAVIRRHGGCL